ncbi:MAG: sigma 54-dependent Fis family transcriptional regulator [Deltaproteobacteria bacterium]|nr:sigma 54-dependent Fis family transcriptional regulator [Deltaproteobacteria bacterium]
MAHPTALDHLPGTPIAAVRAEVLAGSASVGPTSAEGDLVTVGSAPGNDLRLLDETVSRFHLELSREGDRIRVRDCGSTNGTRVGAVVVRDALVEPGTTIALGRSSVRVHDAAAEPVGDDDGAGLFVGKSKEARGLMRLVRRAAESDVSVLILGETGAGKEVIARTIHELSPRRSSPFEVVDCGALMPTLIASEMFGHEKGAFTGADQQSVGALERAHGGTVFLDELGELPAAMQSALLGALERRKFRRLGGQRPIAIDVRLVSATNRDIRPDVNASTFRPDLYYRVAPLLIRAPALRERLEDLPLLIEHFLRDAGYGGSVADLIPASTMEALGRHRWPGNVRELRNFVEVALALGEPPSLEGNKACPEPVDGVSRPVGDPRDEAPAEYRVARDAAIREFEVRYLSELHAWAGGNISKASRHAGINRSHLADKLRRLRILEGA